MSAAGGIEIADLVVARGEKPVLRGISLAVRPAEVTTLIGRNGAGKSTLVLTVAGALRPQSGVITLAGRSIFGHPAHAIRRSGIAAVLEGHRILEGLTVIDNLRAAGSLLTARELIRAVDDALAVFPELKQRLPVAGRWLSGGQKQMLSLAQALIGHPRFLLIDELSLGLAPAIVNRLASALTAIAAAGAGILLIEQFTTLALSLANTAYVMERGQIVFAGTAAELKRRPEVLHGAYLAERATV